MTFNVLQPMLQELGKQNPHLMRLIQEHQPDFLRLINEPVEGEGWDESVFRMICTEFLACDTKLLLFMDNQECAWPISFCGATNSDCHPWGAWSNRPCKFITWHYSLTIGALFHFSLKICSRITVLKLSWSLAFFIHALKSIVGTASAKFDWYLFSFFQCFYASVNLWFAL